ncbi:hypothetical protein Tco_1146696 [Tanacetum coccineum]
MASFDYRLNPLYAIRECSSCGALYNKSCGCSKGGLIDKFVRDPNKMPDSSQRPPILCVKCGNPVEGPSCQGCALWRKKLKEVWFTTCHENGINQDLLNTFESSDDDTNVVNAPREPFVVKQDPGENSSQSPPQINHNCCYECGDSLDGIFCQQCTCKSCGKGAHIGYNCPPKAPIISNPEPCNQTIDELPQTLPSFDPTCYSEKENSLPYVSKPNFVDDSPNVFNPPPQPPIYSCEFCGNDARYGHYCTPQVPFIYPEPCYNQDFNFPQDFHDFQQQYLCCENCGGPHETFQCQPMNEDYYHEQNSCYDSNSFGFDQFQPSQYTVNHPIFNAQNELLNSQNKIMEQMTSICDMVGQYMQNKEEDRRISEDQAAKDRYWKIPICYDDDDDKESSIPLKDIITSGLPSCDAVTSVLLTEEPVDSLIMEDEHLDTISATESDEVIKSSIEELVPIPSEFEDTLIDSSPKFDYLLEEFSGELAHIDLIPPEIEEADFNLEEEICFVENLLYYNSSPRPPKELNLEITDTILESLSLHLLSSLRIVTLLWRILTYFLLSMTRCHRALRMTIMTRKGIFPDTGVVNKVVDEISEHDVLMPNLLPTQPTLCLVFDTLLPFSSENEDKVFNPGILISSLLSHRGEITSNFYKSPMMISGLDIPHLDVPFLHFYPP